MEEEEEIKGGEEFVSTIVSRIVSSISSAKRRRKIPSQMPNFSRRNVFLFALTHNSTV